MKTIIIGNWKMSPLGRAEAIKLGKEMRKIISANKNTETLLCPPFIYINDLKKIVGQDRLGSQDGFYEETGAFTSRISFKMLKQDGATLSIVGHSEVREFGEDNKTINKKLKAIFKLGMRAVLCIGEKERDAHGMYLSRIKTDLEEALVGVSKKSLSNLIIAYEPVWAIGENAKGRATPHESYEMSIFIKRVLTDLYSGKDAKAVPILYGGSVDEANATIFLEEGGVNGLLVGRVSLNVKNFEKIIVSANGILKNIESKNKK